MNIRKLSIYTIIFLFILLLYCCVPKKQAEGTPGLLIKDEVKIYKEAKGGAVLESLKNDWIEVSVLNKDKPVLELIDNAQVRKWYNIIYNSKEGPVTGWINEENIVFKESKPVNGVVLYKVKIYKAPDSRLSPLKILAITEEVQFLGYEYSDGNKKFQFILYGNGETAWATDTNWIIWDGKIAVVFNEAVLYSGTVDVEDYIIKDMVLNEFDIIGVLPEQTSNFVAIILPQWPGQNKYYIKKGALSYNSDDILLALKLNKDYQEKKGYLDFIESKKVIQTIQEAVQSEDAMDYIANNIKDIDKAIAKIDQAKLEMTEIMSEYDHNSPLITFMENYLDEANKAIAELENFATFIE